MRLLGTFPPPIWGVYVGSRRPRRRRNPRSANTITTIPASTARIRPSTKVLELPPPDEAWSGGQSPYCARQTFWRPPCGSRARSRLPGARPRRSGAVPQRPGAPGASFAVQLVAPAHQLHRTGPLGAVEGGEVLGRRGCRRGGPSRSRGSPRGSGPGPPGSPGGARPRGRRAARRGRGPGAARPAPQPPPGPPLRSGDRPAHPARPGAHARASREAAGLRARSRRDDGGPGQAASRPPSATRTPATQSQRTSGFTNTVRFAAPSSVSAFRTT